MVLLQIELPPDELEQLKDRAQRFGYQTPGEYLRAIVEDMLTNDDDSDEQILADLKEAWREMERGGGMTVEDMWKIVENN
jgi:hypothetical protein